MDISLRDPRHRVSPRTPIVWAATGLVRVVILGFAIGVASVIWHWFPMPTWAWVLFALLALGYVVAMPVIRYRIHRWETTDTAVYTQTGWLTRERRVAPMSRVQTVDLQQGPVSRALRLASVTVTTASAAGPLRIEGLGLDTAQILVAELTRRTAEQAGDAT